MFRQWRAFPKRLQAHGAHFKLRNLRDRIEVAGGELVDRFLPGPVIGNKNGVLTNRFDELRRELRAAASRLTMNKELEAPLPSKAAWAADFPIDRVEAQHVSRREFAKYLLVVSGGLAAGSAWVAVRDKLFPHPPITGEHFICKKQDVPVGGTHAFTLSGSTLPYILINLGNDEWRAFEQKCTHLSCAVFYQPKEGKIECPCHNGWFDAGTGAPLQGPPQRPLPQLKLEVRGDDIFVVPSMHHEHTA